jgi:hypothetical protein
MSPSTVIGSPEWRWRTPRKYAVAAAIFCCGVPPGGWFLIIIKICEVPLSRKDSFETMRSVPENVAIDLPSAVPLLPDSMKDVYAQDKGPQSRRCILGCQAFKHQRSRISVTAIRELDANSLYGGQLQRTMRAPEVQIINSGLTRRTQVTAGIAAQHARSS